MRARSSRSWLHKTDVAGVTHHDKSRRFCQRLVLVTTRPPSRLGHLAAEDPGASFRPRVMWIDSGIVAQGLKQPTPQRRGPPLSPWVLAEGGIQVQVPGSRRSQLEGARCGACCAAHGDDEGPTADSAVVGLGRVLQGGLGGLPWCCHCRRPPATRCVHKKQISRPLRSCRIRNVTKLPERESRPVRGRTTNLTMMEYCTFLKDKHTHTHGGHDSHPPLGLVIQEAGPSRGEVTRVLLQSSLSEISSRSMVTYGEMYR